MQTDTHNQSSEFPLVSVCIPNYNNALYLVQCLDSVVNDTYPNLEIVIIDDGSSDHSCQLIEEWINHHPDFPVYFQTQANHGISKTLNRLIDLSHGKYIVWLASDDYLIEGGIQARVNYLEQHSRHLAVFGDAQKVDSQNNEICASFFLQRNGKPPSAFNSSFKLQKMFIFNWAIPGPVLMVNQEIYEQIGRYNEAYIFEDLDFYLRMAVHNKVGCIDQVVSAYRIHPHNSFSSPTFAGQAYRHIYMIHFKFATLQYGPHFQIAALIWTYYLLYIPFKILRRFIKSKGSIKPVLDRMAPYLSPFFLK